MIPPIYVGFTLLAALLLWLVIGARGRWWLKLSLIVLVPAFMFVVWSSLGSFSGWPTSNKPPVKAYFVYGYVIEPDTNYNVRGKVYVWLISGSTKHGLLDYAPKYGEPRAYALPYSKQLEGQVQQANRAVAGGNEVGFSSKTGRGTSKGRHGNGALRRGTYHFYNLRPALPTMKGSR